MIRLNEIDKHADVANEDPAHAGNKILRVVSTCIYRYMNVFVCGQTGLMILYTINEKDTLLDQNQTDIHVSARDTVAFVQTVLCTPVPT